jgi:hypothetical protein
MTAAARQDLRVTLDERRREMLAAALASDAELGAACGSAAVLGRGPATAGVLQSRLRGSS